MIINSQQNNTKRALIRGNINILIILIITLSIIGSLGYLFYQNMSTNKPNNTITPENNIGNLNKEIDKAFDENLEIKPSGTIYKTLSNNELSEKKSIVLYSNGTAVFGVESILGTLSASGIYKIIDEITYVKFKKHIENGTEFASNSILILNPDGTASSDMFDTTIAFTESGKEANNPIELIYFEGKFVNSTNTSDRITVIAQNIDNGNKFFGDSVVSQCNNDKCIFDSFKLKVSEGSYYIFSIPTATNFDSTEKTYFNQCTKSLYVDKNPSETDCDSSDRVAISIGKDSVAPMVFIDLKN